MSLSRELLSRIKMPPSKPSRMCNFWSKQSRALIAEIIEWAYIAYIARSNPIASYLLSKNTCIQTTFFGLASLSGARRDTVIGILKIQSSLLKTNQNTLEVLSIATSVTKERFVLICSLNTYFNSSEEFSFAHLPKFSYSAVLKKS